MDRRIDELRWHCAPHPCAHAEGAETVKAWRYALCEDDLAYSLTIASAGGQLALHRAFELPTDSPAPSTPAILINKAEMGACDLVRGGRCMLVPTVGPRIGQMGTAHVDLAQEFWGAHAEQGKLEQPPRFWRELERIAKSVFDDARKGRFAKTCPRCNGEGWIPYKPDRTGKRTRA